MRPLLAIAFIALASLGGAADDPNRTSALFPTVLPPIVRSWGTAEGLPQNTVTAIRQTRDGYLWLGTADGLARFDGVRFTVYGLSDGLPSVEVRALHEDRNGDLWVATAAGGIGRWHNGRLENLGREFDANNFVTGIAEDSAGQLWIGTRTGLRSLRDGKPVEISGTQSLKKSIVRCLTPDGTGTMWVCTWEEGLLAFRDGQLIPETGPPEDEKILAHCLLSDSKGRLWASIGNGKVLCREHERWRVYSETNGLPFAYVTSLAEDAEGTIWAGSLDAGLYRFDGERFHAIHDEDGLSAEDIRSLHTDREGNLWVGTRTGGLNQLSRRRLLFIGAAHGLTNDFTRGVAQTTDGTIWAATIGGSLYYGGVEGFQPFRPEQVVFYYAHLETVLAASDGSLWWGGGSALLHWQDGKIAGIYTNQPWVKNRTITALREDRNGGLWIGNSSGALVHFQSGTFIEQTLAAARGGITSLAVEPNGDLWVGSVGGVQRVHDGVTVLVLTNGLVSQSVRALYLDSSGALWIGTSGGGLSCWRNGRTTTFTAAQGFTPRTISQILEDDHGFLWLGCGQGIFKWNKQALLDCADGKLAFVHGRSFGANDGLLAEECSGGFCPAGLKTKSGLLCFSTVRGLAFLNPNEQTEESVSPRVLLEEARVNGQVQSFATPARSAALPARIVVPPGRREIELHYTAIHFSAPEKINFRHRLRGASDNWNEASARRTAYFQSIDPGTYTFEVEACNPDGIWSEEPTAVELVVQPHVWETGWFRVSCALGLAGALWWFLRRRYKARLARLQMQNAIERERLRISKDMHDHVGSMLTQVSQLTDMTLGETENQETVTSRLNRIGKRSRDAVQALDEIVWATNPKNDNLASFAEYVSRFGDEFFEYSGIRCWQEMPASIPALPLRADIRHNVFLSVREACNNVAKHSKATEVWIRLKRDGDDIWLEVQDNGCGFDLNQASTGGNGLENMRVRLMEDGGRTIIDSAPGKGATVRFIFPVRS